MRAFLIVLVFSLPGLIPAQSDFLKDPNIVWAAEMEQDWVVDIPSLEEEFVQGVRTLKLLRTPQNTAHWKAPFLPNLVFQAAFDGKITVFQDPNCLQPADIQSIVAYTDTITIFDQETYEEYLKVVQAKINPSSDVKAWRVRQILTYHKSSASWSITAEAIAPLVTLPYAKDTVLRPLFWFRLASQRPDLGANTLVWSKEIKSTCTLAGVSSGKTQLVKLTDGFQCPFIHWFGVMKANSKTPFFSAWIEPQPNAQSKALAATSFYPETLEDKIAVVQNDVNPSDIRRLSLVQTWYWDEARGQLSICLDGVAPLLDVKDESGRFKHTLALFYSKTRQ